MTVTGPWVGVLACSALQQWTQFENTHKCFLKGFHYFSLSAGCDYNGQIVPSGQPVGDTENRCETCVCRQGNVECTAVVCEDLGDCRSPTVLEGDCCPVCMDCGQYADGDVWTPTPCRRCSCQVCWEGGVGGGGTAALCAWTAISTLILEMSGHLHIVVAALVRCADGGRGGQLLPCVHELQSVHWYWWRCVDTYTLSLLHLSGVLRKRGLCVCVGGGGGQLLPCVHELPSVHWYWWRCVDTYLVVAAVVRCVVRMWGEVGGGFQWQLPCTYGLWLVCADGDVRTPVHCHCCHCQVCCGGWCWRAITVCISAWRGSLWQDPVSTNWLRTPLHTPRSLLSSVSRSVLIFQVIG